MYRESILGLALAATIAEMHPRLTTRQEEEVWRVFDASMEVSVAEAPLMSHASVHIPPPSSISGGGMVAVATAMPQLYVAPAVAERNDAADPETASSAETGTARPAQSSGVQDPSTPAFDDSAIAFPVYRRCDDTWTILLKDPTVVVRDGSGRSERMQLDYLKVCLKDINNVLKSGVQLRNARRKRTKKA